ncbi:MAG: site-specific DNA-methyltransferase [Elusimicrobiota bacterium]
MVSIEEIKNKIICSDALAFLKSLPDECIDMCLTSPPYWGLRDYKVDGQVGLEPNYQDYIRRLVDVFVELKRVIKKTGSCYVVMGDTYMDKELLMIPSQLALALKEDGWQLRNILIWHKPNSMPSSVKDRYKNSYEFVFFFVKNRRYFFDLDSIREPHKTEIKTGDRKSTDKVDTKLYGNKMVSAQVRNDHDIHFCYDPKGKNPGDIIQQNLVEMQKRGSRGMAKKIEGCAGAIYGRAGNNPNGKNPGDIIDSVEEKASKNWKEVIKKTGRPLNPPKGVSLAGGNTGLKKTKKYLEMIPKGGKHWEYGGMNSPKGRQRYETVPGHPLGKNPGDVIMAQNAPHRGKRDYKDPEKFKQKQQEWFSGEHENNPRGKNPGDVVQENIRINDCKFQFYSKSSHGTQDYHPLGKNPGDVIQQNLNEGRLKMSPKGPVPATQDYHKSFTKRDALIEQETLHHGSHRSNKGLRMYKKGRDEKYPEGPPNRHGHGWGKGYGKHTFLTGSHPLGKNPGDVIQVPYSVQPRDKEIVEYRNLPEHDKIREYLTYWRKQKGITIEDLETMFGNRTPHHWFEKDGSYPDKDDWLKIKQILGFDDKYDRQMTEILTKPAEKQNHPLGKNPGDIYSVSSEDEIKALEEKGYTRHSASRPITGLNKKPPELKRHYLGKNPGDIIKTQKNYTGKDNIVTGAILVNEKGKASRYLHYRTGKYVPGYYHKLGKNPGDVVDSKYNLEGGHTDRQGLHRDETAFSVQRVHKVSQNVIADYLREWKKKSKLTYKQIDEYFGYKDCASHWFAHEEDSHGACLPGPEEWLKLKKLLKFDDKYDKIMTETYLVSQAVQNHPDGKNPGDTIEVDEHPKYDGVFRGGMKLPPQPGNPTAFHPLGKNPGDVQEIDKERGYKSLGSHPGNTTIGGLVEKSKLGIDIRHPLGTNPGDCADDPESSSGEPEDFWAINTKPFKGAHFAVFPEKLCEKPIKSSCPEGGIVVDPFCGSGTVCVVAHRFGRNYIGVDLNPDYCELARKRLEKEKAENDNQLKLEFDSKK